MNFTAYKFDNDEIKALVETKKDNLFKNKHTRDLLGYCCKVLYDFTKKDKFRYRAYGCYWFALKSLFKKRGFTDLGNYTEPLIEKTYCGETDEETLVMAERFSLYFYSHFFKENNRFILDEESGEEWILYDPDIEENINF